MVLELPNAVWAEPERFSYHQDTRHPWTILVDGEPLGPCVSAETLGGPPPTLNIYTMSTGVNMHAHCSKGVFVSWHLNAKVVLQGIGRLGRISGLVARAVRQDVDANLWLIDRYARRSPTAQITGRRSPSYSTC